MTAARIESAARDAYMGSTSFLCPWERLDPETRQKWRNVVEHLAGLHAQRERRADLPGIDGLAERERAVLAMIADGATNAAIAERYGIAAQTVKNGVSALMLRLGARNRAALAAAYARWETSREVAA